MPFCTYCGQAFTRDEHLERHILTHTNIKPYKCLSCHMSFARRDLLNRHYTVHGRDENQEPLSGDGKMPKTAGRTPIACNNCAKTKTKCDKKFPCSRCEARKLKCTARPTRRTTKTIQQLQNGSAGENVVSTIEPDPTASTETSALASAIPSESSSTSHSPPREQSMTSSKGDAAWTTASSHAKTKKVPSQRRRPIPPTSTPHSNNQVTFINLTPPMTSFDNGSKHDGRVSQDEMDTTASSQYLPDWSQMLPMGEDFNQMAGSEMLIDSSLDFAPDMMQSVASCDSLPAFFGGFTPDPQPMSITSNFNTISHSTPPGSDSSVATMSRVGPFVDRTDTRPSYLTSDAEEIIRGQGSWSTYKCTPILPVSACPKTARINLQKLKETLERPELLLNWTTSEDTDIIMEDSLEVMALLEMPRDKLLAITQTFLHKAFEIHADDRISDEQAGKDTSNFVLLPPARTMQTLLKAYCNNFERFYPLIPRGRFEPNTLMYQNNDKASSLLMLQMIAQGALSSSSINGRWLTAGLTETCRISLFDLIEKDIKMSADPMVLHAALIFTVQAGWSGDKWQMDIAMGQSKLYLAMLRHSGYLSNEARSLSTGNSRSDLEMLWNDWIWHESRSRLAYAWVMVDQELALFDDKPAFFAVSEFCTPMPDTSALWLAKSASSWSHVFEQVHEFSGGYSSIGSGARPLCLRDLFRLFHDDEILSKGMQLTPMHMRLLLQPLQSLVCQYCQLLSCFSDTSSSNNSIRNDPFRMRPKKQYPQTKPTKLSTTIGASSTAARLGEIQTLLQRWYDLADHYLKTSPICPVMQSSLILFHLISLNAVTNMPEIERLARREGFDEGVSYHQLAWMHAQCIADVEEAIFHAGQALRLVREMPRSVRPSWWVGAVYRVALVLWCDGLVQSRQQANAGMGLTTTAVNTASTSRNASATPNAAVNTNNPPLTIPQPPSTAAAASPIPPLSDNTFPVDALPPDHPLILRYLTKREGVPVLSRSDGAQVGIDDPGVVLGYCVDVVMEGVATRFSDGVCGKLRALGDRW